MHTLHSNVPIIPVNTKDGPFSRSCRTAVIWPCTRGKCTREPTLVYRGGWSFVKGASLAYHYETLQLTINPHRTTYSKLTPSTPKISGDPQSGLATWSRGRSLSRLACLLGVVYVCAKGDLQCRYQETLSIMLSLLSFYETNVSWARDDQLQRCWVETPVYLYR